MKRPAAYIAAATVTAFLVFAFFGCRVWGISTTALDFLKSYGWECEPYPIEKSEVIIPDPFDLVYESYNKLQLEAGLDLRPYAGRKCMRYTYRVTNYPQKTDDEVRANVLVCGGECIGGDICTVAIDGFMHSLAGKK